MSEKETPDKKTPERIVELPEESIALIAQRISHVLLRKEERIYSGPLPPPQMLKEYEGICPGAADRIISLAEKRTGLHGTGQRYEFICTIVGQTFGFISFISLTGAGFWVACKAENNYQLGFALACLALPAMGALRKLIDGRKSK